MTTRALGSVVLPALLALLLLGSGGARPFLQVVSIDGKVLVEIPLHSDPTWTIEWHHSVTGNLVRDSYRYEGGQMLLTATRTPAFDAGLGHIPGRGRLVNDEAGGYLIEGIDEPVPGNRYLLRVGSLDVDHTILHGTARRSLSRLAAGQRVLIQVVEKLQ